MVVYYKEYVDYLKAYRGLPGWFEILQLAEIEQQQADVELSIAWSQSAIGLGPGPENYESTLSLKAFVTVSRLQLCYEVGCCVAGHSTFALKQGNAQENAPVVCFSSFLHA